MLKNGHTLLTQLSSTCWMFKTGVELENFCEADP